MRATYRLLGRLYRAAFPALPQPSRIDPHTLRRILVVRLDRVGDLVLTTPVLAYLRAVAPQAEIDVLVSPANASLLDADQRVSRIFVSRATRGRWLRVVPQLRARRYDLVYSAVLGKHLREGLIAALASRPHTARVSALRPPQYHGLFTHLVAVPESEGHMARRLLYAVQVAVGNGPPPGRADIAAYPLSLATNAASEARADAFVTAHVRAPFLLVNTWATEPWRILGRERSIELIRRLALALPGIPLVLSAPPGKLDEAESYAREAAAADLNGRITIHPATSRLHDLVSIVRRATLVVTVDTALVHIAAATGRPLVALYASFPKPSALWHPLGVRHRKLEAPPGERVDAVPLDEAVAAAVELWHETTAAEHRSPR